RLDRPAARWRRRRSDGPAPDLLRRLRAGARGLAAAGGTGRRLGGDAGLVDRRAGAGPAGVRAGRRGGAGRRTHDGRPLAGPPDRALRPVAGAGLSAPRPPGRIPRSTSVATRPRPDSLAT